MLTITRTYYRIDYHPEDESELRTVAKSAFVVTETAGKEFLPELEPGTSVRVEEGSIEIIAIITSTASVLFTVLSNYGNISESAHKIVADARRAGEFIQRRLRKEINVPPSRIESRVTTGQLLQLEKLTAGVENGWISNEEAIRRAVTILRRAGEEITPDVHTNLENTLGCIRVLPPSKRIPPPPEASSAQIAGGERLAPSGGQQPRITPRRRPKGIEIRREPGEDAITEREF